MNDHPMQEPVGNQSIFIDYFNTIRRRKWLVLFAMLGILIPVVIWTHLTTPVYEAETTIIYDEPRDTMFALDVGQPFYNKSAVVNVQEQIQSRSLALDVAKSLPPEVLKSFKLPESQPPGFSLEKYVASIIRKNLSVITVRGSDILKIIVQANDPLAAKIIANTYVERLVDWNVRKNREEVVSVRNFVESQLAGFATKLNDAEEALRTFKENNKLVSLSDASTEMLSRMTEAEATYNQVKTERGALEQRQRIIAQKKRELAPAITVASNPRAQQLKAALLDMEVQYSSNQLKGKTDTQSDMLELRQSISQTKQELIDELLRVSQRDNLIDPLSQIRSLLQESITLEVDLETLKAREQALKQVLADYESKFQLLPHQELEVARLIRDRDVNNKIYSMLLEKREEAKITEAGKIGDIHLIDPADVPIDPIKPKKKKNYAVGFVLALSLGIGLAFFLESLDTTLKSQEDVEKIVKLPVLTSIPNISNNGFIITGLSSHSRSYDQKLLNGIKYDSPVYEAYRALHLNFAFVNTDGQLKCILMTSSGAGEGKTLNSINVCLTFAKIGVETLLIDCDLRRPKIHHVLKLNSEPGLSNLLISKVIPELAIQRVTMNFSVLTCGTLPPNPSELLTSKKMKDLIQKLRSQYDFILLDAPPLLPVTDALALGNIVDGVCMIIKSGITRQDIVLKAKQMLENSHARIIGVILNGVNFKNVYGYYKQYYYYSDNGKKKYKKTIKA